MNYEYNVMWLVTVRHIDVIYVDRQTSKHSAMVDCTRGTTWSTVETLCLIDCWSEDEIETDLSGVHRNRHVYSKISYKMREHGYLRSWDACRNKIKSLRVQYLRAKQQNNTSGQERTKFMFFEHIDKFMGTRPIVQPELVVNAGAEYINIDEENESTGK